MRPGQHNNKQRGRNRNRSRHTGGGSGSSGGGNYNGNPANRVFDSNGPDVKLRGTAQTVAEKYMQLGRDAQASGDNVMAESYFQHSEHYYRLWLANQPVGQPIQFARRTDEEMEEDQAEGVETDDEQPMGEAPREEGAEPGDAPAAESESREMSGDSQPRPQRQGNQNNNQRDNRDQPREGRERFRPRWPRRNDRDNQRDDQGHNQAQSGEAAPAVATPREEESGNWEAPSFLTRAVPAQPVAEVAEIDDVTSAEPAVRRPRREFKPRRPRGEDAAPEPVATPDPAEG